MIDKRCKNFGWTVVRNNDGSFPTAHVHSALLMDIRDELKSLNRILSCSNFLDIPFKLDAIKKNTTKAKRKKKPAK